MELKDFIKTSVSDIVDAITELKKEYNKENQHSTMYGVHEINPIASRQTGRNSEQTIDFDIAVSTTESAANKKEGKIGIKVLNASIGGGKGTINENSSRIKFSIPFYPEYIKKEDNGK